jgi:hypothetical protein
MWNSLLLTLAPLLWSAPPNPALLGIGSPLPAACSVQDTQEPEPVPEPPRFDHAAWTTILGERVRGDRFDYAGLVRDRSALDGYLARLEAVSPSELGSWSKPEQKAFFINAYNAYVVSLIVDNYPLASINDLSTKKLEVWDKPFIPLGEHLEADRETLSLNELEHELLRERYPDARIHVAVNCASEGCPPLRNAAFTGKDLDEQLDEQARKFVADGERMKLLRRKQRLEVSKIFEWFAEDFERDAGSVQAWIQRYAPGTDEERAWIGKAKVKTLEYSWKLNDAKG